MVTNQTVMCTSLSHSHSYSLTPIVVGLCESFHPLTPSQSSFLPCRSYTISSSSLSLFSHSLTHAVALFLSCYSAVLTSASHTDTFSLHLSLFLSLCTSPSVSIPYLALTHLHSLPFYPIGSLYLIGSYHRSLSHCIVSSHILTLLLPCRCRFRPAVADMALVGTPQPALQLSKAMSQET